MAKYLKRTMRLVASNGCDICEGTGIQRYSAGLRKLEVTFDICPCVRVKPIGLYLPKKTPDVIVPVD
jgi:hypothetical protein